MTWKLEEWVYPVRDENRRIIRPGRWKPIPSVDSEEAATKWVAEARPKGLVRRALGPGNVEVYGYPHSFYIVRPV